MTCASSLKTFIYKLELSRSFSLNFKLTIGDTRLVSEIIPRTPSLSTIYKMFYMDTKYFLGIAKKLSSQSHKRYKMILHRVNYSRQYSL